VKLQKGNLFSALINYVFLQEKLVGENPTEQKDSNRGQANIQNKVHSN